MTECSRIVLRTVVSPGEFAEVRFSHDPTPRSMLHLLNVLDMMAQWIVEDAADAPKEELPVLTDPDPKGGDRG